MLNPYIWKLYMASDGINVVRSYDYFFEKGLSKEYIAFIRRMQSSYQPSEKILSDVTDQLSELNKKIDEIGDIGIFQDLYLVLCDDCEENAQQNFSEFSCSIAYYSTILSYFSPTRFIPYYFQYNFNVLQMIAEQFEIDLPEIPKKSDYRGRFYYYEKLCSSLHAFREANHLSVSELCAFLYDFAPKYIGGTSSYLVTELPSPHSAFFIGSKKDDRFLSDEPSTITPWQCNPDTRAGDMILMYLCSPVSAVDSVWRSCSVGFVDPFFYYYRCTYICHPQKIDAVSLSTLRQDSFLSAIPIVRKNMQGVNGVELKPSEFNHLMELGNNSEIRLEYVTTAKESECSTEKEVEDRIIKPLLSQLGYGENDYVQQLYIEIGNHNHALIPDFVLLPEKKGTHKVAFAVVEAKRSITSYQQLQDALSQVRSYAKLLSTKFAVIISQEKVWIFSESDDYEKTVLEICATSMTDDHIYVMRKIIGK